MKKILSKLIRKICNIQKVRNHSSNDSQSFKKKTVHDPHYSYMNDPDLQSLLIEELAEIAQSFFSESFPTLLPPQAGSVRHVQEFFNIYSNRSLVDNTGGSGFHNAFWLYLFTKSFQPELIIESGVWKGHTTWLFHQANPTAEVIGFDINLKHLEYKSDQVTYIQDDWHHHDFSTFDPQKSLIFFDCHINHAQRLLEAEQKGFKHLIFDDNPPVQKLYSYGKPGFPTAQMLKKLDSLSQNEISWTYKGQTLSRGMDAVEAEIASQLIKRHIVFPDVGGPTRYGGFSFLTYVQI